MMRFRYELFGEGRYYAVAGGKTAEDAVSEMVRQMSSQESTHGTLYETDETNVHKGIVATVTFDPRYFEHPTRSKST